MTLILVSQRAEDHLFEYFGTESMRQMVAEKYEKQRGNLPYILEYVIFIYVIGKIVLSIKFEAIKFLFKGSFTKRLTRSMWRVYNHT